MFENLEIKFEMAAPVATMEYLYFDGILAAAVMKENMGDDWFDIKPGEKDLKKVELPLDSKYGVWCASIGFGKNREFIGSWCKRWDSANDDLVKFDEKNKKRVDIASGHYKGYHMPLVIKSFKTITFYASGDYVEIIRLLNKHIHFIGKKASQGHGEIGKILVNKIDEDKSLFYEDKPMRPIPVEECKDYIDLAAGKNIKLNIMQHPVKPPYWRTDCMEYCFMP
jgi:CRISPR type IV-associated protein Csf3